MKGLGKEHKELKGINTPYDDAFRTMLQECKTLIIPVVNEIFGTDYNETVKIDFEENEIFMYREEEMEKRITDSSFSITSEVQKKFYHIECQSTVNGSMVVRMFEYDSQIALKEGVMEGAVLNVHFPQSAILYLRHNSNTPDIMKICIHTPGGSISYPVMVMKVKEYDIDEIFEKKLLFLIPFYIFSYESGLGQINEDVTRLRQLRDTFEMINSRLERMCMDETLDRYTKMTICEMAQKVVEALANRYANVKKEVTSVMGGKVLEYKAKDILRQGESKGKEIGKEIGLDALVNTLRDMLPDAESVHEAVIRNEEYRDVTLEQIRKYY